MQPTTLNPLSKHFRQPAIYLQLPSKGRYWTEDSLDLPVNGEIAVYPMTSRDEITLRTPDALLNGQGVIDVIQSCCPNIRNAWQMPSIDVDATLIAIRIASYGNSMGVDTKCTHCDAENSVAVDLGVVLSNIRIPDYNDKVEGGNSLYIKLKPQAYFSVNKTNQIRFEEQKILIALSNTEVPEEVRINEYSKHMAKIVDLNIKILVDSTEYIESDGDIINDITYITEFYNNCNTQIVNGVQKRLQEMLEFSKTKTIQTECDACKKIYGFSVEFDQSNFFGNGS